MNSPIESELTAPAVAPEPGELMIRLQDVAVRYRAPEEPVGTLKEYAIRRLQRRVRFKDFYALDGINLDVHRGEILGVIGRNGAGKSTLLKVISRVLAPTRGRVYLGGQVSPLLELGAGFHPELTGRENVMLNGTLLGRTVRELEQQLDAILGFAELGGFIDAPLRTYSSGMAARLGFAVATAWQPDILLLDEVLAVGDEAFQRKCNTRMQAFRNAGATVLMVTHNMATATAMCARAAWIERGQIRSLGPAETVVNEYRAG
jgi:ABC-type polysaccharide/polyol phosphate transport system ATPase subunit